MSNSIVTDQSEEILATYNLCLIGPQMFSFLGAAALTQDFSKAIREAEENLTDLLPEGYRVVIKEWDSE